MNTSVKKIHSLLLLLVVYAQILGAQTDYLAYENKEGYYKKVTQATGLTLWLRFERLQQLVGRHEAIFARLSALKGRLECRLRLSLQKEKVMHVKLLWESDQQCPPGRLQRFRLKKIFQQLQFELLGQLPKQLNKYKTTWLFSLENGQLRLL